MFSQKEKTGYFQKKIKRSSPLGNYFHQLRDPPSPIKNLRVASGKKHITHIYVPNFPFSPKIRQALQIPKTKTQNITIDTTVKNKYVLQFADNHQKDRLTADLKRT